MKNLIQNISLSFFLLFSTQGFSQNLFDNLLIYYPLDGNADDASGNGFHGAPYASPGPDRFGNPDKAYYFNGINQHIDFPNNPALKPQLPISYSFWVMFEDLSASNTVLVANDFVEDTHSGVWMNLSSQGYAVISFGDASGTTSPHSRQSKIVKADIQTHTWYHFVGVARGPNDMDIYIGCNTYPSYYEGSGGPLAYTSYPGGLGRKDANVGIPAYYFKGAIDDFCYWDRALTPAEIEYLCGAVLPFIDGGSTHSSNYEFEIFPNPAVDFIQIKTDYQALESISILDLSGKEVYNGTFQERIDISLLKGGIYLLRAYRSGGIIAFSKKLLVPDW